MSARSASTSTVVTAVLPSAWLSRAALYPVPVPISSTVWPGWAARASSMVAISDGVVDELVAVAPVNWVIRVASE